MPYIHRFTIAAVAAALVSQASVGPAAAANPAPPRLTFENSLLAPVTLASECPAPLVPLTLALGEIPVPTGVETSMVTYRPRPSQPTHPTTSSSSSHSSSDVRSVSQVNLGYFVPSGGLGTRFDLGVRGGPVIADALQIGVAADWMYRTETISQPITSRVGPGGVPITQTQQLARATVNMFPIMAFSQLHLLNFLGLHPYIGGAAGYEVLLLSGEDFTNGASFDGTFGGWGWQAWAGGSLPLGNSARLTGEAFFNDASLGRDTSDPNTGDSVHETVDGNGKGLRFGIAWGF